MKRMIFVVGMFMVFFAGTANAQTNGWMSRYWDGCKQSCSWSSNAGGIANACKECDRSNNRLVPTSDNNRSSCQGGNSYTCWDMIPFAVDDNLAYGFVATNPPNQCGTCYEITFTGAGEHGTNDNHRALQGKRMIVMAANIGGDVGNTQLDLMVPGGGLGLFDSFTGQTGISTQALGHQYGGILRQFCETGTAAAQRTCLRDRCNSVFSAPAHDMLRRGCVFYADWLMAASNPRYTMRTVTCPQLLRDIYSGAAIGGGGGGGTPTTYTLTVNRNPTGGGTTTPAASQANIAANTNVNISATAASGWTFTGWTAGTGATITNVNVASTTVRLTANATITANFTQQTTQTYTLTVNRNPTTGGTTTPAASQANIAAGTAVPIAATAAAGHRFVNWTVVSGTATFANPNSANTTVTLSTNATIRANFVQTLTLTVNRLPTNGGTTTPAANQADIAANSPVSISATPATGFRFVNWTVVTGTATFANANALSTTVSLSTNATIRANFEPTFTLTVNRTPAAGGTTSPATSQANIASGTAFPISATAAAGYVFSGWTLVTGTGTATIAAPNSANTTVSLTTNATVRANFTQQSQTVTYTLTINRAPTAGGTVTPASGGSHNAGTPIEIAATAATGYTFTNWTVTTGTATFASASNAVTTVTLSSNATITANFTQGQAQTYTLTINSSPTAGGTVTGAGTHNAGTPVEVRATAASGYTFSNWTVTGSGATIASPNSATTTVTLTANATITANFTESGSGGTDDGFLEFTLNIQPPGSGRIEVVPNKALYLQGEPVSVTAIANPGFEFEIWNNSGDLHGDNPEFNTQVWWHREITAQFKTGGTNVITDPAKTAPNMVRTRASIVSAPGGFTATLPASHTFTSYRLIDLQGREIRSGAISGGVTDLRFSNIRRSVLFLQLNGSGVSPEVLKVVTY